MSRRARVGEGDEVRVKGRGIPGKFLNNRGQLHSIAIHCTIHVLIQASEKRTKQVLEMVKSGRPLILNFQKETYINDITYPNCLLSTSLNVNILADGNV